MTTAEILDEGPDDPESVFISWLKPMFTADGHVSWERKEGGKLPFYLVNHIDSIENVGESYMDALVSVRTLTHRAAKAVASRDEARRMHGRITLLARYLEDVPLDNGRVASIQFVDVIEHPRTVRYEDPLILARRGLYKIGLGYQ